MRGSICCRFYSIRTSEGILELNLSDGVANLTLNNFKKRNALSMEMVESLYEKIRSVKDDSEVRMLILRANGTVFSSGHNLVELKDMSKREQENLMSVSKDMMRVG